MLQGDDSSASTTGRRRMSQLFQPPSRPRGPACLRMSTTGGCVTPNINCRDIRGGGAPVSGATRTSGASHAAVPRNCFAFEMKAGCSRSARDCKRIYAIDPAKSATGSGVAGPATVVKRAPVPRLGQARRTAEVLVMAVAVAAGAAAAAAAAVLAKATRGSGSGLLQDQPRPADRT